jgi:hypothetical protein
MGVKKIKITFTNVDGIPNEYFPKPALEFIPDWYKKAESYVGGKKKPNGEGVTNGTIKRCMPVFDAITGGYIIELAVDVWVSQVALDPKNPTITQPYYEWPIFNAITFHAIEQVPGHPLNSGHTELLPKWTNPWAIKTPPGYSTLFVQPFHRESVFTILPAIVDTDKYHAPVNFPFALNDIKFEGLIPSGTPIAQVIPFKRDSWERELGGQEENNAQFKIFQKNKSKMFDSYKSLFRTKKEYL